MRKFFKRLYRERRRAALTAALLFVAGVGAVWHVEGSLFAMPVWLVGGLAFLLILTPVLLSLAVVFQPIRHVSESIALALVLLSVLGAFGPGPLAFGLPRPPLMNLWGFVLIWIVVELYARDWLDRIMPAPTLTFRSRATSHLPPDRLWPALAMTPETAHLDPNEDLISIEWIDPGESQRLIWRQGDIAKIEEIHHIKAAEPGALYSFRYEPVDGKPGAAGTTGSKTFHLHPAGTGTEVLCERVIDRASWRGRLFTWVDDAFGRAEDTQIARIERAAGA